MEGESVEFVWEGWCCRVAPTALVRICGLCPFARELRTALRQQSNLHTTPFSPTNQLLTKHQDHHYERPRSLHPGVQTRQNGRVFPPSCERFDLSTRLYLIWILAFFH